MRCLLVILCLSVLMGCSSGLANPGDIQVAGSSAEGALVEEGKMIDATPTTEDGSDEVTQTSIRADLEDYGAAPELTNDMWLNTDKPLRLTDLRDRVILLEMWTFG